MKFLDPFPPHALRDGRGGKEGEEKKRGKERVREKNEE